ncbi:MAG: hypothetical protein ABIQ93_15265 [Saprospiraceae bacterium]
MFCQQPAFVLLAPSEVYYWRVEYEAVRENGRQRFTEKGDVTLLR